MGVQLSSTAKELAEILWREHTVYRERSGGVVIRGEHVRRWISLAPAGSRDEVLVRAGRILDGGTTAPARSEAVVPLSAGTDVLAATCRRLLAEAAADVVRVAPGRAVPGRPDQSGKAARPKGSGKHTSFGSWVILACVAGVIALYVYSTAMHG
ncbi:hypothetical protein OG883_33140 [Streptomyces sp. NBC_01142]|uniref:hypothetical protein n=1 Tax=Streptomyces sp. NBC_01142 TaxID=2975865 RepID=UPI00225BC677|nr:hypothetical protein [Streptomyces sp. NBC_01142]MCX4824618.1 hypothetical protein [Streptomyces sp. NBC_01142]